LPVFSHITQVKPFGQVEIQLDGGALPEASDGVPDFDVNLGPVKNSFALVNLVGQPGLLQGCLQSFFCFVPVFQASNVLIGSGGQIYSVISEAKGTQQFDGQPDDLFDFIFQLVVAAEDMSVILGEAAHPAQAVEHPASFIPVDGTQLSQRRGSSRYDRCLDL